MLNLKFAELHGPLFLSGVNFGNKLDIAKRSDLKLCYDRDNQELLVTFKSTLAIIPSSNIVSMTPQDNQPTVQEVKPVSNPTLPRKHAERPDQVFEGQGEKK